MIRRIAVTGGGTAGHVLSALDFLRAYHDEYAAETCFLGCGEAIEARLAAARGQHVEVISGRPWARQSTRNRFTAIACLPKAIREARRILARYKSQLVIGAGGYGSIAACIAARSLGIRVVIHEANAEPGLANRILSHVADLVCVGFPTAAVCFSPPVVVTGIPSSVSACGVEPKIPPWRFIVLGGSEGSPILNSEAPKLFAELSRRDVRFSVHHIAGFGDCNQLRRAYAAAGIDARVDSFIEDMTAVYSGATMAISSSGARTLAELSSCGIPAILAPLPQAANDHQAANARLYAEATGATVIRDKRWDVRAISGPIEGILSFPQTLQELSDRTFRWSLPTAAIDVVRACERILVSGEVAQVEGVDPASTALTSGKSIEQISVT